MHKSTLRLVLLADISHVNCQRWCEGLEQAGAEIHIVSFQTKGSHGKHVYQLPGSPLPGKLHYIAAVPYVRRLINTIKPHIVAAYYVTGYGTIGALTGYHPLVQVTSGSDVLLAPQHPVMKRVVRFNLSQADLVTAWAPHMAEAIHKLGVPNERILVLPRGIPAERFANVRCSPPSSDDYVSIISTRSLRRCYKLDLLLRATRVLKDAGVPFRLTLAGDGPQREELVALSRELQLEQQVRFAGFVSNDQLPGLLAQHNLYVSPVDSDGVSASLLEAMAVGLLPLVPDNPANRFWINTGENGILLNQLLPVAVADAVAKAISNIPMRQGAWERNLELIRSDADLYKNSKVFVEQFRRLARNSSQLAGAA
jgi:glycosyltransferase involved in cell wall biosynthesis